MVEVVGLGRGMVWVVIATADSGKRAVFVFQRRPTYEERAKFTAKAFPELDGDFVNCAEYERPIEPASTGLESHPKMVAYEYRVVRHAAMGPEAMAAHATETANRLAKEGWELVSSYNNEVVGHCPEVHVFYRRPAG